MSDEEQDDNIKLDYGNLTKRIVFTDNDHRHAQFLVRLRYDGLRQSQLFRHVITGYIEQDERLMNFVDDIKKDSKIKKAKSKKLKDAGKELLNSTGFSDDQIEDIFDLIAEEHPEL